MGDIGTPQRIYEIPDPVAVPDTVPADPVETPTEVPAPAPRPREPVPA